VAHTCNSSYYETEIQGLQFEARVGKKLVRPYLKNNSSKKARNMAVGHPEFKPQLSGKKIK
jgi:hypothetical protein